MLTGMGLGAAGGGMALGEISKGIHNLVAKNWRRKEQRRAFERAVKAYRHRYQWTMEDMRKAGLNPILAARGGIGGVGSVGSFATPGVTAGGGSYGNIADIASAMELKGQQGKVQRATVDKVTAEADTAKAMARMQERIDRWQKEHPEVFSTGQRRKALGTVGMMTTAPFDTGTVRAVEDAIGGTLGPMMLRVMNSAKDAYETMTQEGSRTPVTNRTRRKRERTRK